MTDASCRAVKLGPYLAVRRRSRIRKPAAGTALGMVMGGFSWVVVIVLMFSVLVMTIVQRLMLPYLKDTGVKCYDRQSFD